MKYLQRGTVLSWSETQVFLSLKFLNMHVNRTFSNRLFLFKPNRTCSVNVSFARSTGQLCLTKDLFAIQRKAASSHRYENASFLITASMAQGNTSLRSCSLFYIILFPGLAFPRVRHAAGVSPHSAVFSHPLSRNTSDKSQGFELCTKVLQPDSLTQPGGQRAPPSFPLRLRRATSLLFWRAT